METCKKSSLLFFVVLFCSSLLYGAFPEAEVQNRLYEPTTEDAEITVGDATYGYSRLMQQYRSGEDRSAVGKLDILGKEIAYFIIADGHGGSIASTYAAKELPRILQEKSVGFDGDFSIVLKTSVKTLEDELLEKHKASEFYGYDFPGSTLLVVLLEEDGTFHTAHVGDAFAQLGEWTTVDHSPSAAKDIQLGDKTEADRVKEDGGEIVNCPFMGCRVSGLLLTRAIGDFCGAEKPEDRKKLPGLSAEPFVASKKIEQGQKLILASDGVKREDIIGKDTVEEIRKAARDRRETDDISVISIHIK